MSYELVETGYRSAAGSVRAGGLAETPLDADPAQSLATQPQDVGGVVDEEVSRILIPAVTARKDVADAVHNPAPIRVKQPPYEFASMLGDYQLLPRFQFDLAPVLSAEAVLGKQARPKFRAASYLDAAVSLPDSHGITRMYRVHCALTFVLETRPRIRAHDPQNPDIVPAAASAADASVAEVEAEQVGVAGLRHR